MTCWGWAYNERQYIYVLFYCSVESDVEFYFLNSDRTLHFANFKFLCLFLIITDIYLLKIYEKNRE